MIAILTFSLIIHLQNCISYGSSLSPSGNVTPGNKYTRLKKHCKVAQQHVMKECRPTKELTKVLEMVESTLFNEGNTER